MLLAAAGNPRLCKWARHFGQWAVVSKNYDDRYPSRVYSIVWQRCWQAIWTDPPGQYRSSLFFFQIFCLISCSRLSGLTVSLWHGVTSHFRLVFRWVLNSDWGQRPTKKWSRFPFGLSDSLSAIAETKLRTERSLNPKLKLTHRLILHLHAQDRLIG